MDATIYHNPACGTSRNTLAMLRHAGVEPAVILYLEMPVRGALRTQGTPYLALGLDQPGLSDEELIDAMLAHPILINRPFVVTPLGTRLCRPSEVVLDVLPKPFPGGFHKEDGEPVPPR